MKGVIYCYHCIPTGKKYIGQTKRTLPKRHISHKKDCKSGVDTKFYRAVRKYGWENFIVGIINEFEFVELDNKEIFFIMSNWEPKTVFLKIKDKKKSFNKLFTYYSIYIFLFGMD
jgi:group I intron endonuclease